MTADQRLENQSIQQEPLVHHPKELLLAEIFTPADDHLDRCRRAEEAL